MTLMVLTSILAHGQEAHAGQIILMVLLLAAAVMALAAALRMPRLERYQPGAANSDESQ